MQDGLSDIHNSPVIASSLHLEGKFYFLSATGTGADKKTASVCTSVAEDAKKEASESFDCNDTGVVTDNEKKMDELRQNFTESNLNLSMAVLHTDLT